MKKLTEKLLVCVFAFFALLLSSCGNAIDIDAAGTEISDGSGASGLKAKTTAYLSLILDGENSAESRTAFPEINAGDFDEFILQGKEKVEGSGTGNGSGGTSGTGNSTGNSGSSESEAFATLGSWSKTSEKTAYALMQSSVVEIVVGNWDFKLSAKKNGALYEGSVTNVEIHTGLNEINFTVELIATSGGTDTSNADENGSIEINFTFDDGVHPYYEAKLVDVNESSSQTGSSQSEALNNVIDTKTGQVQNEDDDLSVLYTDVPAGSYVVKIFFFEDAAKKLYIGGTKEYAHVIGGTRSSSTVEIGSLDKSYEIVYYDGSTVIENSLFAGKFTRHNSVNLPDKEVALKSGFVFCGWYEVPDFSGGTVYSIPENEVGNKTVYAKFMSLEDVTPILQVQVEGTKKVGETLTAVPYTVSGGNPSAGEKFNGAVENYEWFLGEDANSDGRISEDEWTSCGTEETYQITKNDVGKAVKVSVTQKYTVNLDGEKNVYVIQSENEAVISEVPDTIGEADKITKGTLNVSSVQELLSGESFRLTYDMSASFDSKSVEMGSALSSEKIIAYPSENSVKDSCGNDVPVIFEVLENAVAPDSSDYVNVLVKSDGYEDYEAENLLFITVREKTPSALSIQVSLQNENLENPAEAEITYGYIKFAQENTTLEYALTNETDSEWHVVNTDEFKNGSESFESDDKIFIRRKATEGTPDAKENPVGYIAPSEAEELTIAASNIGKKNAIKGSNVSLEENADIAVTSNVDGWTVTLSITDYEKYENVVWETDASILGLTENLTVAPTMSDGVCTGATVTCAEGRPGTYSIVLSAKDKTTDAVYSTTINVTFSE